MFWRQQTDFAHFFSLRSLFPFANKKKREKKFLLSFTSCYRINFHIFAPKIANKLRSSNQFAKVDESRRAQDKTSLPQDLEARHQHESTCSSNEFARAETICGRKWRVARKECEWPAICRTRGRVLCVIARASSMSCVSSALAAISSLIS